ncbi:tachykinin-like peptides receptor 86C isoform X1 [Euwallacea fornicatus]|uniref:tachykinin-like peptides receptor 86C isoform X1 n=1 Tax=Euwallacea fornicatus TaxID=995702 RepID=UPI0033902436
MNYSSSRVMNQRMEMEYIAEIAFLNSSVLSWPYNTSLQYLEYGTLQDNPVKNETDPDFPRWIQAAWISVFGTMVFVAACGNCIVIWIVTAHRRMRTVTNYFLVNLSVADLLLTLFNCIFNSIYMIQRNWPFGTRYCTISNFIANATVTASVFTLTGISCDRYLAIVRPLHPRMSRRASLIAIFIIWTASMTFASPCLLYSTTITHRYRGSERVGCIMIWPDKQLIGSKYDLGYQMLFLVVAYLVPMTLMSMCYAIMGKVLWGSKSIGELTQRQLDSIQSKRKVVKMFILVVLIFGLCWLPYHSYFIYIYYDPRVIYNRYTQHIYLTFYWLAMSNAMVNPLIYYWMNARFRQYFRKAMCCWRVICSSRAGSKSLPPTARNSINSYTQSAGAAGASMKKHRNQSMRQNGNIHYDLMVPGVIQGKERKLSNRATRTTSLRRDLQKTTYL